MQNLKNVYNSFKAIWPERFIDSINVDSSENNVITDL